VVVESFQNIEFACLGITLKIHRVHYTPLPSSSLSSFYYVMETMHQLCQNFVYAFCPPLRIHYSRVYTTATTTPNTATITTPTATTNNATTTTTTTTAADES